MKKILINIQAGLNDIFSGISFNVDKVKKENSLLENIYVTTYSTYKNLNKFLTFKKINYINGLPKDISNYEIYGSAWAHNTNLNLNNEYHLSNLIEINSSILEQTEKIYAPIGVHFRFMSQEFSRENEILEDIKKYKDQFLKIYDSNSYYVAFSTCNYLDDFLLSFKNVYYKPKNYISSNRTFRQTKAEDVLIDLSILSKCNIIYRTEGWFVNSAKMLGKGIPEIKNLL